MNYTWIIVCFVVHSDCRFQQCSMAVLVFIPLSAFGPTVHLPPRTWHLLPSLQISKVDMPTGDIVETKGNSFCSKWYHIWKHWTWEPYKQCYLSASFKSHCFWESRCNSSPFIKASTNVYRFATLRQHSTILLSSDGCRWSLMDAVGRQVIRKVADHYYKHS